MDICKLKMNSPDTILLYRNVPTFNSRRIRQPHKNIISALGLRLMSANNSGGATASEVWRGGGGFQQNISETAHTAREEHNRERERPSDGLQSWRQGRATARSAATTLCVRRQQPRLCRAVTYRVSSVTITHS